jgi:hypothetical protein
MKNGILHRALFSHLTQSNGREREREREREKGREEEGEWNGEGELRKVEVSN